MGELAELTWQRVAFAEQGFSFREDSLTEHNLFELARRHPQLRVQRFNGTEEATNGADWEWWVGGPKQGWVGLRIQAKKLSLDGTYHEISHTTAHRQRQYDLLISSCLDDGSTYNAPILPFYCFYNGWSGPGGSEPTWPEKVRSIVCPADYVPPACRHVRNIRHFGCAISSAVDVAAVHQGPYGSRTTLNGHLSRSRPWSHLFHEHGPPDAPTATSAKPMTIAASVLSQASAWLRKGLEAADSVDSSNHGQLFEMLLRRPSPELPSYAGALLDGRLPRSADWPEATFIAVLNTEASEQTS